MRHCILEGWYYEAVSKVADYPPYTYPPETFSRAAGVFGKLLSHVYWGSRGDK